MLGIIALQTVKGRPEQAWMLRTGGFSNAEIAEMLDTSDNGVSVLLYKAKQKRASKLNGAD
jgi:DNA-directed RNA polymerase specialized sigma24 family protein